MVKALAFVVNLIFILFITYGIGIVYPTDSLLLKPMDFSYFIGIVTSSLIHDNIGHLISNAAGLGLFYFFLIKEKELERPLVTTFVIIILSNIIVFLFGNPSYYYLGSSNVVYALAGFSLGSIICNRKYLLLIPMIFLGGTLARGMMIESTNTISYVSHYFGLFVGIGAFLVINFRTDLIKYKY